MGKRVKRGILFWTVSGPPSLFERVHYIMAPQRKIYIEGKHFKRRVRERNIPESILDRLRNFNSSEWKLIAASVGEERGKFVNSLWEIEEDGIAYRVSIGTFNYATTIYIVDDREHEHPDPDSEFYKFVESVNRKLMDESLAKDAAKAARVNSPNEESLI